MYTVGIILALWTSFVAALAMLLAGASWRHVIIVKIGGLFVGGVFAWLVTGIFAELLGLSP